MLFSYAEGMLVVRRKKRCPHHPYQARTRSIPYLMNTQVFSAGSRIRVISYSPFRGLRGTIRTVDSIPHLDVDEPFCFYHIDLEGAHIKEPIWFEHHEVELISPHGSTSLKSA